MLGELFKSPESITISEDYKLRRVVEDDNIEGDSTLIMEFAKLIFVGEKFIAESITVIATELFLTVDFFTNVHLHKAWQYDDDGFAHSYMGRIKAGDTLASVVKLLDNWEIERLILNPND